MDNSGEINSKRILIMIIFIEKKLITFKEETTSENHKNLTTLLKKSSPEVAELIWQQYLTSKINYFRGLAISTKLNGQKQGRTSN